MAHEGVVGFPGHDFIDRARCGADRPQRGFEAAGRHRGVGVELHQALLGRRVADCLDVAHGMTQRDRFEGGGRRLLADQRLKPLLFENALDRAQPLRPLGMARRVEVIERSRMGDQKRRHRSTDPCADRHIGRHGPRGKGAHSHLLPVTLTPGGGAG